MKQKGLLMLLALGVIMPMANIANAKGSEATSASDKNLYTFLRTETPNRIDTWNTTAYTAGLHEINTLSGTQLYHIGDTIVDFVVSPTGSTLATVQKKKNKSKMQVMRSNQQHKVFKLNTKKFGSPRSVAYMPDARQIAIAAGNSIYFLETKKYEPKDTIKNVSPLPDKMVISDNGYFLAAVSGDKVNIYNIETHKLRKSLNIGEKVNDVKFSPGSSDFGVLTDDGVLTLYNTRTFEMRKMIDNLGTPSSFSFNLDGKYVAVSTDDNTVDIVNLLRDTERESVDVTAGGSTDIDFMTDANNNTLLISTINKGVMVRRLPGLEPFYSQLISEEADRRMDEWMKMMPNETMEQYKARVTEESMKKHRRLIEDEISTDFAAGLIDSSKMSFGSYDRANEVLAINFDTMPTIYLPVPVDEVTDFTDPSQLLLYDVQYGVLPDDTFEVVYARITNNVNGKTYLYDNLLREVMDFMNTDDAISIELLQQQRMEEIKLNELREKVVEAAKSRNVISDHTNISVDSKVFNDYDADGNKILNYQVKFSYEVEPGFSATEDFAAGKYRIEESGAGSAMVEIVKKAFEGDLKQYVVAGKKLRVNLLGTADATPILHALAYDGCYGEIEDEPVYIDGQLNALSVTTKSGIAENEQLALLRALGVQDYLEKNVEGFTNMKRDYRYDVEVSKDKGSEFRRITATFVFVDAFETM